MSEERNESPLPAHQAEQKYDFGEAMRLVARGKRLTRLEWGNPDIYIYLDGHLLINMPTGLHVLKVSSGDILGTDWVEVRMM